MLSISLYRFQTVLLVKLLLLSVVILRVNPITVENICRQGWRTCGQCIAAAADCHWCSEDTYSASERCDLRSNLLVRKCNPSSIVSPLSDITYVKNDAPRNARQNVEAVQLSPQHVDIKLRTNKPFTIPITFRQAEDYPVDLYFLMDMSYTMKVYKETLAKLSQVLASKLKDITKDFRLGFGSFVDKTTLPYTDLSLTYSQTDIETAYGYRNQLSLTDNVSEFEAKVNATHMSANLDDPEGGFDALVQVLACKNEIGWRINSRKLVLFLTNGGFHYAGDGKLAGIIIPNDGHCHMDSSGYYMESLNQDYPSISQLAQKIAASKVNVIFAVTQSQWDLYGRLSSYIEGSAVGLLNDSAAVIRIVQDNYNTITSSVELKTDADDGVLLSYQTRCLSNLESSTPKCSNVGIGKTVTFELTLQVTSCVGDEATRRKKIEISPIGLNERLTIMIEQICECDCEKKHEEVRNSERCHGNGTLECGVCTCNAGYYGNTCECSSADLEDDSHDATCIKPNSTKLCEEQGTCECGLCKCKPIPFLSPDQRFSGEFCECNDYNCDTHDGMPCGGPARGVCRCSSCQCHSGYTESNCKCHNSTEKCIDSHGGICNGKGECLCNECVCSLDTSYKGKTCEDCPTCHEKCDLKKPCVQCHFRPSDDPCYATLNCTKVELVDLIHVTGDDWHSCQFRDDSDFCDITFVFNYNSAVVIAERTKQCSVTVSNTVIIASVIGAIIAIGIIFLFIWKVIITVHDRREYARFEKEREKARWNVDENPLYKKATSTFQNPTFASKKQ